MSKILTTLTITTLLLLTACSTEPTQTNRPSAPSTNTETNLTPNSTPQSPQNQPSSSDQILLSGAISNLDPTLCDSIESATLKSDCKIQITDLQTLKTAQQTGNFTLCPTIQQPQLQKDCQAYETIYKAEQKREQEYNQQVQSDQEKMTKFIQANDLKSCQTLHFPGSIQDCELNILQQQVQTQNSKTPCTQASTESIKQLCLDLI